MSSNRTDLTKMGKHIYDLRKNLGYTQKQLGEILDVSDKTISKWEQGSVAPDITILNALATALKVDVNEILYGEKKEEPVTNDESVNVLSIYSAQTKHDMVKKLLLLFFVFIITAIFIIYIEDYYKWNVTRLSIKNKFVVSGTLISNYEKSKIVIDDIHFLYDSSNILFDELIIKNVEIKIFNNEEIIYDKNRNFDDDIKLYNMFNNYMISFEINDKTNKKNLKIEIKFFDYEGNEYAYCYNF